MGGGYKLVRLEQLQSSPQWQWWWETNPSHCNEHRTSDPQWLEVVWILTTHQRSSLGDNMVGVKKEQVGGGGLVLSPRLGVLGLTYRPACPGFHRPRPQL